MSVAITASIPVARRRQRDPRRRERRVRNRWARDPPLMVVLWRAVAQIGVIVRAVAVTFSGTQGAALRASTQVLWWQG